MWVVGGGAGDVKEPLPLYFEQRALLGWAVQGDGAAVMDDDYDDDDDDDEEEEEAEVEVEVEVEVEAEVEVEVEEEERSKRRGRAWCWWCGRMGSTARIGRCVVYKDWLPDGIVDEDDVAGWVVPYEIFNRRPMAWWWMRTRTRGRG